MLGAAMTPPHSPFDDAVRQELLQLALRNSSRSVPLQLAAVGYVAYLGWDLGLMVAAATTGVLGVLVAVWRLMISHRYLGDSGAPVGNLRNAEHEL